MTRSRIAIFEGYGSPFSRPAASYGRPYGAPPAMGRRAYVPERNESATDSRKPYRKAYKVAAKRNTPKMKRAQKRFARAAKTCSRRKRGTFQACMKKALKSKRSKR